MDKRVLVVEDEDDLRLLWRTLLEAEGHDVLEAATGKEARSLMRSEQPDLILLDGHLSDGSGWDVLEEIRADDLLRKIPVIIATGDTGMERRARERGAVVGLTKPVAVQDLRDALRAALASTAKKE